ncbi:uncharacterized protein LOC110209140 [Phascolarctos cinereus]|uniref:Uncharacterized protein LOC110209140 n=1 Tax=Phascolarctos cinereus TaxID=38626 RepID=A0A6P5KEP6_PHACI|nr:uncharacterized protein LOC110209140 [Phascolarctos cinereus]
MEALRARVVSTLDRLSPPELEEFKFYLRSSGKKPRIPMEDLDTAPTTSALADLLVKRYVVSGTPRVLVRVFQRMRRNDLVAEWVLQNIMLDILRWCGWILRNSQHQILQRDKKGGPFSPKILSVLTMTLKRQYENDGPKMERYNMEKPRKAFVMCVKTGRPGAKQDMKRMRNWLKACKFECTSCINPDEKGLMEKLREFRDGINKRKDDVSCCLVTLMAHGGKAL